MCTLYFFWLDTSDIQSGRIIFFDGHGFYTCYFANGTLVAIGCIFSITVHQERYLKLDTFFDDDTSVSRDSATEGHTCRVLGYRLVIPLE